MENQVEDNLVRLAESIHKRNQIAEEISSIIGRPAQIGHVGEYIASKVFQIKLEESAAQKAIDGYLSEGPFKGKSVNIRWYAKRENLLDITPDALPDFYLVETGPKSAAVSSKGQVRPWVIESVYLFDAKELTSKLYESGLKVGDATSIREEYWGKAKIYPTKGNEILNLNRDQIKLLDMFR